MPLGASIFEVKPQGVRFTLHWSTSLASKTLTLNPSLTLGSWHELVSIEAKTHGLLNKASIVRFTHTHTHKHSLILTLSHTHTHTHIHTISINNVEQ